MPTRKELLEALKEGQGITCSKDKDTGEEVCRLMTPEEMEEFQRRQDETWVVAGRRLLRRSLLSAADLERLKEE